MEASKSGMLIRQHHPMRNVIIPPKDGRKFRIQRGTTGQRPDLCPITCNSQYVSKQHCEIYRKDKVYWLKDVGSTNGTYLNAVQITANKERELRFSDIIGIGVSHNDQNVDVTSVEYFIFKFDKVPENPEDDTEVIDLDDDPLPVPVSKGKENCQDAAVQGSRKQMNVEGDEEEIKIVCEVESPKVHSDATTSSVRKKPNIPTHSPSISTSLVAQTPVISRPPVQEQKKKSSSISSSKVLKHVSDDSDTGSSDDFSIVTKSSKPAPAISPSTSKLPPKSDSLRKTESTSSKRVVEEPKTKSVKRVRTDSDSILSPLMNHYSSDDSSDGLEDSNDGRRVRKINTKRNPDAGSISALAEKLDMKLSGKVSESDSESSESDADLSNKSSTSTTARASVVHKDKGNQSWKGNKHEVLKTRALKSRVRVSIPQAIIFAGGRYKLRKNLKGSMSETSYERIGKQFQESQMKFGDIKPTTHHLKYNRKPSEHSSEDKLKGMKRPKLDHPSPATYSSDSDDNDSVVTSKRTENGRMTTSKKTVDESDSDDSVQDVAGKRTENGRMTTSKKTVDESDSDDSVQDVAGKRTENGRMTTSKKAVDESDSDDSVPDVAGKRKIASKPSVVESDSDDSVPEATNRSAENGYKTTSNDIDMEEELQPTSPPNEVESPMIVEKSPAAEKTTPRRIMLIDHPPLPRSAQRAQSKTRNFPVPHLVTKLNKLRPHGPQTESRNETLPQSPITDRDFSRLTKEEQKNIRSQKLKDVELKKQQERDEKSSKSPEKRIPTAKIKITSRNRNQGLMESIIGSKTKDNVEELSGNQDAAATKPSTTDTIRENGVNATAMRLLNLSGTIPATTPSVATASRNLDAHTFKVPSLPLSNTVSKGHNNQKSNQKSTSDNIQGEVKNQRSSNASEPPPVPGPSRAIKVPTPTTNQALLKPGARAILSPPGGIGNMMYKEKSGSSSVAAKQKDSCDWKTLISEEDIFLRMFAWRPVWLHEQKEHSEPPPVLKLDGDELVLRTAVVKYQTYEDYMYTYYPLLLSEIWHVISSDASKSIKSESFHQKSSEYRVRITGINREGFCHFARPKPGKPHAKDESWCNVVCESWWEHLNERNFKKDFVILTIFGKDKNNSQIEKKVFGLVVFDHKATMESIGGKVECDPRLKAKGARGYRFREMIQCRISKHFPIDMKQLGYITQISYIMPKIREFRGLNCLQSSKLFNHIVSPPKINNPWTSSYPPMSSHQMIRICHQLNSEQQSMVNYITSRVFSNDPELMLMHGPPGTGKTTTIVALVLQLIHSYRMKYKTGTPRILICTPSNAAIDEIMRRLIKAINDLPSTDRKINMLRVGDGCAKELEKYTVGFLSREKEEEKSTSKTLKIELESLNHEVEEKEKEVNRKRSDPNRCLIQYEALLCKLQEVKGRRESVLQDLNMNKKKGKPVAGEKSRNDVIKNTNIICSTLSGSSNSLMRNAFGKFISEEQKHFMCCIIDEASQTTEPETLLPIGLEIDKLILIGDPKQLGATVLSPEADKKNFFQSLFKRLFEHYDRPDNVVGLQNPVMTLRRQYRMHKEIVHFPNAFSYDGKLETYYKQPDGYLLRPYYFLNLSSGRELSKEGQIENVDEVELVKSVLEAIQQVLQTTQTTWTVGVITPYSAQKQSIRNALQDKTFSALKSIQVDTVDGFQGQERDIIILSCVRTEATGFLKSATRLNVALTRAKHSMYIIGDLNCLSKDNMWKCLIQDAARRGHTYKVNPDFRIHIKALSTDLINNLKNSEKQRDQNSKAA